MNYIIGVDCEGPACVVGKPEASLSESPQYDFARRQATREADAAARALLDGGAKRVIVWDNHGGHTNLLYDELDVRIEIACGPGGRWPGLTEEFAGVLLIGYHAMGGTPGAVLAHTFSSKTVREMRIDGEPVGEIAIDAALAGRKGVPVLFAAGDDKTVTEAERFLPGVVTVTTKRAYGWNHCISKHPDRVVEEIHEAVSKLSAGPPSVEPYRLQGPLTLEIDCARAEQAESAALAPRARRIGSHTVAFELESLEDHWPIWRP